jgi:glutamine---fructose-6-phosphate transaminase (isomerizing)
LLKCGYQPNSETDSELYGYLILEELKKTGDFTEAVRSAFLKLEGSCSVVVMSENNPGLVIGIRNGSPLVCAKDPKGGAILASDAQALLSYTQDVIFLENNDMVIAKEDSIKFLDVTNGKPISRESTFLDWSAEAMDKQGYPHYMLKEIYEQPQAFVDTLNGVLDRDSADPFPLVKGKGYEILTQAKHIVIVMACRFIGKILARKVDRNSS